MESARGFDGAERLMGLLGYEADFIIMTPNGYLTEIEIKSSFEDFKADFKKDHHHDDERIYHFYYCVPENIKDKVTGFPDENFKYGAYKPALLTYDEDGHIQKRIPGIRQNANTIF